MMDMRITTLSAMKALDNAGGRKLTNALRAGYAAAARVVRDRAKATRAFKDRTGTTRKSWKVSQSSRPYNHAKLRNTAPYSRWLEKEPRNLAFIEKAARATGTEQLNAVGKAVRRHLAKLRAASK